jgi:NADH-quinone oxidoreductase subunit J
MTAGSLFFGFCALACLVGAISTVLAKNPIRSAVGLLVTVFGIAGLFLLLSAQFLAAIQLIVSAGAVVVLFVFVIMLLGPDARAQSSMPSRSSVSRTLAGVLGAVAALGAIVAAGLASGEPRGFVEASADHGSARAVGTLLFTEGLVPFEVATALLIVAVVGAIALARTRPLPSSAAARVGEGETRRMFAGPVEDPLQSRSELEETTR